MEFNTYTTKGLTKKLHVELKKDEIDTDLVIRINDELKHRATPDQQQMSINEQIYWILKDTNFEKIQKAMEALDWTWGGNRTPTIIELIHEAENRLRCVANFEQDDYENHNSSSGGFRADRDIFDGVMCLSLKFVLTGWHMDYESVISDNYSDIPYKEGWDSIEVGKYIYTEGEEDEGDY